MKLGFTGTHLGMTRRQLNLLRSKLLELRPTEFHHGDCVGADEQAHNLVRQLPFTVHIVLHPPIDGTRRAHCKADQEHKPKPFLERNRDIVNDSDHVIAAPEGRQMRIRSGTWSTYRYANSLDKKVELILP